MEQTSASLAAVVRTRAQQRGYQIDGAALARVNVIDEALEAAGFSRRLLEPGPEAERLQAGMVEFAEATMAAAAADAATTVGVAHVNSAHAKVRRGGIFPFSGRRG